MTKEKEPPPKPPDSLEKLAEFTKKILRVPKDQIRNREDSTSETETRHAKT